MRGRNLVFVFAAVGTLAIDAAAQPTEAFMTIPDIPGRIAIRMELTDWSQIQGMPDPRTPQLSALGNPLLSRTPNRLGAQGGGSGARSGRVELDDFSITKELDKTSPKIAEACASGKVFPRVTIEIVNAGRSRTEYFSITMANVMVTNSLQSDGGGRDRATESVEFQYESLTWEVRTAGGFRRVVTPDYSITPRPE
jgi:hypothetical protein